MSSPSKTNGPVNFESSIATKPIVSGSPPSNMITGNGLLMSSKATFDKAHGPLLRFLFVVMSMHQFWPARGGVGESTAYVVGSAFRTAHKSAAVGGRPLGSLRGILTLAWRNRDFASESTVVSQKGVLIKRSSQCLTRKRPVAKPHNDTVQQRGRLRGLHASESRNAGPVCLYVAFRSWRSAASILIRGVAGEAFSLVEVRPLAADWPLRLGLNCLLHLEALTSHHKLPLRPTSRRIRGSASRSPTHLRRLHVTRPGCRRTTTDRPPSRPHRRRHRHFSIRTLRRLLA